MHVAFGHTSILVGRLTCQICRLRFQPDSRHAPKIRDTDCQRRREQTSSWLSLRSESDQSETNLKFVGSCFSQIWYQREWSRRRGNRVSVGPSGGRSPVISRGCVRPVLTQFDAPGICIYQFCVNMRGPMCICIIRWPARFIKF